LAVTTLPIFYASQNNRNTSHTKKEHAKYKAQTPTNRLKSLLAPFLPSFVQNNAERCEREFFNNASVSSLWGKTNTQMCLLNAHIYRLWREKKERVAPPPYIYSISFSL